MERALPLPIFTTRAELTCELVLSFTINGHLLRIRINIKIKMNINTLEIIIINNRYIYYTN